MHKETYVYRSKAPKLSNILKYIFVTYCSALCVSKILINLFGNGYVWIVAKSDHGQIFWHAMLIWPLYFNFLANVDKIVG